MRNSVILDASVVVKWFTQESDSDKAIEYLKSFQKNEITILVPSLLFYELGNTILKKGGSEKMIGAIQQKLQNLQLEIRDIGLDWLKSIYQNSFEYSITFYDAAYVTLMQNKNCTFVTADKKLFEKTKKKFAGVTLL